LEEEVEPSGVELWELVDFWEVFGDGSEVDGEGVGGLGGFGFEVLGSEAGVVDDGGFAQVPCFAEPDVLVGGLVLMSQEEYLGRLLVLIVGFSHIQLELFTLHLPGLIKGQQQRQTLLATTIDDLQHGRLSLQVLVQREGELVVEGRREVDCWMFVEKLAEGFGSVVGEVVFGHWWLQVVLFLQV
jgi:hypothetical protein